MKSDDGAEFIPTNDVDDGKLSDFHLHNILDRKTDSLTEGVHNPTCAALIWVKACP